MNKEEKLVSYDVNQIMDIIPHRPPFLLIDKIIKTNSTTFVEAIKNVTVNEPFFKGHFPGSPIMPGVLIVEAAAQAAAILVMTAPQCKGKIPFFMSIDKVKFRKPVVPGDQLLIRIDVVRLRETTGRAQAVITVDGNVVTEALLTFVVADPPKND